MPRNELDKMLAGEWYSCLDPELEALRMAARRAVHEHRVLDPDTRGAIGPRLLALLGQVGRDVYIEAPFHCSYGFNITLGEGVYINAGCTILDSGPVTIGPRTMLGPNVQIYCAEHQRDASLRAAGQEVARPVSLGCDVWIGGGAVILPGARIGDRAIVGAGSVVTRDVAADEVIVGNPGRPITRQSPAPDPD